MSKLSTITFHTARYVQISSMVSAIVFTCLHYANTINMVHTVIQFRVFKEQLPTLTDFSSATPLYTSFNQQILNISIRASISTIVISLICIAVQRIRSSHKIYVIEGLAVGLTTLILTITAEVVIQNIAIRTQM